MAAAQRRLTRGRAVRRLAIIHSESVICSPDELAQLGPAPVRILEVDYEEWLHRARAHEQRQVPEWERAGWSPHLDEVFPAEDASDTPPY